MSGAAPGRVLPAFEILGPLRARRGGEDLDLGPGKQRAVLAVLLVNANRPVATAQIVDAVWRDDPPENGANVVQKYVAGLRRVLEPDRSRRAPGRVIALTDAGYVLSVEEDRLDTWVFARELRRAYAARDAGCLAEASEQLQAALGLWRGIPLSGLSGPLFDSFRDRLAERRAAAQEAWADVELRLGRHLPLVPALTHLVAEYPMREELRYQLILALYRCGRQAESLAAFRDARHYLVQEFGVEPGERLQELHRRVLRADPALAAPAPSTAAPSTAAPSTAAPSRAGTATPVAEPGSPPPPFHSPPFQATPPPFQAPPSFAPPLDFAPNLPTDAAPIPAPDRGKLATALAVAIPAATCGMGSWIIAGYFAVRRRSLLLVLSTVGYLAIDVLVGMMLVDDGNHNADRWLVFGIACMFIVLVCGTVQGAVLSRSQARWARPSELGPAELAELRRRICRENARHVVHQNPAVARQLGIGRPDLPRHFDDGGLVDINGAPVEVLAALPGVGWERARRIVAHRETYGTLSSVDDLVMHGMLPYLLMRDLHDYLVAVPAAETVRD
jgi:SARP family transcriptional regulator, regulator of embCAB operon